MSRLIEVLRKAEEEKRKDELTKKNEAADAIAQGAVELESDDSSADSSISNELETEATHSVDFELEPTETLSVDMPAVDSPKATPDDEDTLKPIDSDLNETTAVASDNYDDFEQPIEDEDTEPRESQDYSRRQTDTPLEVIIPEEKKSKPSQKPKLFWLFVIGLFILLSVAAIYFFFLSGPDENKYSSNLNYSQNRGFLGDTNTSVDTNNSQEQPEKVSSPSLEKISSEQTENNNLLSSIENITDSISENTIGAISAVNDLLKGDNNTADSIIEPEQEAAPIFQISRPKTVKGTSSSLSYAQDNVQGGEYDAARMEYQELLRNQPTNRNALIGLAELESEAGNNNAAKEQYSQLLQLNPRDPIAQVGLLESTQQNDLTTFEAELRTLASTNPRHAFIPFKLGGLYASQNRWNEAKKAFSSALERAHQHTPDTINPDYAFNLAVALEKTQQPQLALEKYLEAKELSVSESSTPGFDLNILNSRIQFLEGGQ